MKQLLFTLCLSIIFSISLMGQEELTEDMLKDILDCLPELGNDNISSLNVCESKCLNFYFQKDRATFDFCKKRVVFFKGNTGTIKSTKKEYFDGIKQMINNEIFLFEAPGQLIIFNENEVKQIGYDVAIVNGSKKLLSIKDVIKRLNTKDKNLF